VLVLKFANDSINAWQRQEAAVAAVEARLASTGNAIGMASKELQDMASDLQKVGIFGDEVIMQNLTSQLMTFGNIGSKNFKRIQEAALDVTATLKGVNATGTDLQSTAIMMGKALDDPTRGLAAMRRIGIAFNNVEAAKITALQKSGKLFEAQNMMLGIIERQYGGTNEALRKTSAGMERAAKNDMGDVMEQIGKQIVPLRESLFRLAAWILPQVNALIPVLATGIKILGPPILAVIAGMAAWRAVTYGVMAAQKIMMVAGWVKYLWMMRAAIMKAVTMTKAWAVAQKILNFVMSMNPIGLIIIGIAALIAIGVLLYKNWDVIKVKLLGALNAIWSGIQMVGRGVMTALMAPLNLLISGIIKLLEVASKIPGVGKRFAEAAAQAKQFQAAANRTVGSTNLLAKEAPGGGRSAPNQTAVQSQRVQLDGNININNAPAGTTASAKTRGPGRVNMQLAGVNP
jgi:hypothetical protein